MSLAWILFLTFCFMVFFVGGYMFLMLNVMRVDPKEQNFRKDQNETIHTIMPKQEDSKKDT